MSSDNSLYAYLENHEPEPVECPECDGKGYLQSLRIKHRLPRQVLCDTCNGEGVVEADE